MEVVGSGLHSHVHHSAQIVAEIRRRAAGNQIKFLNGFWRRHITHVIVVRLVVVHAIEKEIVFLFAGPVHVGPSRSKRVLRRLEAEKVGRNHTWR